MGKLSLILILVMCQLDTYASALEISGQLPAGSIVKVPAQFQNSNRSSDDETLLRWLQKESDLREVTVGGTQKKDYFMPVEVVNVPAGSKLSAGQIIYVPLTALVQTSGTELKAIEDSEFARGNIEPKDDRVLDWLNTVMVRTLNKVDKKVHRNLANRQSPQKGMVLFNQSCPIRFQDFRHEVQTVADKEFMPPELLLGIMQLESGGRCFSEKHEHDGSRSVGLFQINTKTASVPRCRMWQLSMIKKTKSIEKLKNASLKCLENPVINLEEAASVLRSKYASVNSRQQPQLGRWYTFEKPARDDWRKALSAYSGGQSYVFQAYNDIESFNRTQGTQLDANDWETRRIFFFRRILEAKVDEKLFDQELQYRRKLANVLINMAYVESIVGRENTPANKPPLVYQWIEKLYFDQILTAAN